MNKPPKPMLACKDWAQEDVRFPVYVQPKYDGVRAVVSGGVVYGRSGDPIKNRLVQELFGHLEGCDGELVASGKECDKNCCRLTTSIVNSPDKEETCDFIVYDDWSREGSYLEGFLGKRMKGVGVVADGKAVCARLAQTVLLDSWEEVEAAHKRFTDMGFEGSILRLPGAKYKHGRSGKTDKALLALKDFVDTEAEVVGFTELMHNANEAEKDAFGRTKRSTKKAGKVPSGTLGTLICKAARWEKTFEIGTGFSAEDRKAMWLTRELLPGRIVRFKFFDHGGKDKPRHPVFITFRDKGDMS